MQAAYEGGMSLWGTIMGGVNLIEHAAGWLEGGLTASFEKLILDAEMLQMMRSFLDSAAGRTRTASRFEAMQRGRPRRAFLRRQHTRWRASSAPSTSRCCRDWRNFENWSEGGAKTGTERANAIWKELLRTYEQPPLDPAIDEELEARGRCPARGTDSRRALRSLSPRRMVVAEVIATAAAGTVMLALARGGGPTSSRNWSAGVERSLDGFEQADRRIR